MDTVTPSVNQPQTVPALELACISGPQEQKKPLSAAATLLRTLHLKVLGSSAAAVSSAAKARIFVPVSALGWLSCAAVNRVFKAASWVTGVAKNGEESYALSKQVQELTQDLIDASQNVRDGRQSNLHTAQAAAQAIPVIGTMVGIASSIAAKEAQAERAVTWWAKRYTKGVFEFLRYSSPAILQGLHSASATLEAATSTIQAKLYTAMTRPDAMSDTFRNLADRTNALHYKALCPHTKPRYTQAPQGIKLVKAIKQESCQPEIKTIDTNKVFSQIGPHIVSKGSFYSCFSALGNAGSSCIESLAYTSRSIFESLGATSAASWITSGLNKSATALEILMILPYGKQVAASLLEKGGVPVYEVEKAFAKVPEAITKHAVAAEGMVLGAIAWADSKIEQADGASKAAELQSQVSALTNQTFGSIGAFAEAVVEDCIDKSSKFICQSEVYQILKSREDIIAYADKLGLKPESQEFLLAIQEMATSGHIIQAVQDAGKIAKEAASTQAASWQNWFQQGLEATVNSVAETRIGIGLQHLSKAIEPTAKAITSSVTSSASTLKDYTVYGAKRLLGQNQALPTKVKEQMEKWQQAALQLAATKAESQSCELSQAALLEIGGLWGALLQQASSNDPFSRFLRDAYMNSVHPTLEKALGALDAAHNINAANYNFLSAQMDANLQTELQMQQFLSEKAKIAHKIMNDESQTSISQCVAGVASWGFPILSWLFLSSQTLTVLPFIMQRVMPHVLRSTAQSVQSGSKPFWFFLAHNTKKVLDKGAIALKSHSQTIGGWLQQTFNNQISKVTGLHYIDPARIINFKNLSQEEQEYLFEKTGAKAKNPHAPYELLVEQTLKALDAMNHPAEEVSALSLRDYFQLSSQQQEDILFAVAHSASYKHYMDADEERIVKKFNKLPKTEQPLSCRSVAKYKKMTISDKEQVRLSIAKNVQVFTDISGQNIEERMQWNDQMTWNFPIGWEFSEFQSLEHTTNHRLRNMLQLYSRLKPEERSIMTPAKLKSMSKEQLEHLISIVDTYHPELADMFKERTGLDIYHIFSSKIPFEQEKLFSALASLYNMLPPGQKAKLLELTADEFNAMPEHVQKELTLYLMHTAHMPQDGDVVQTFNSLDRMQQAEFRESKELAELQKEAITTAIEKEIGDLSLKLKALQRRITRLTDGEYLAIKEQCDQTKRSLDATRKDRAATVDVIKSLKEAKAPKTALQKAQKALQEADKLIVLLEAQSVQDSQKLTSISTKLTHLHELEHEQIHKLTSLNSLLGTTMDVSDAMVESPKLSAAINDSLNNTLNEVGKSIVQSLYAVIKQKTIGADYKQAIKFSREFLDEAISLRKKHLSAVEARIKNLKSELSVLKLQKDYQAIAEKRLQLRAHTNFTLKLNQALLGKFIELRQGFETQIPTQISRAAPAA